LGDYPDFFYYFFSVSRTASDESGQNNGGLCGCRALANLTEAGIWANEVEVRFSSRGSARFAG